MNWQITDSITLTMSDDADDSVALLTVRGKDHDVDVVTMAKMRDALNEAIKVAEARRAAA